MQHLPWFFTWSIRVILISFEIHLHHLPPCCPLPLCPCLLTVSPLALSSTPVPSSLLISSPFPSPLLFSPIFLSAHLFSLSFSSPLFSHLPLFSPLSTCSSLLLLSHYTPFSATQPLVDLHLFLCCLPRPVFYNSLFIYIFYYYNYANSFLCFIYFSFYHYSKQAIVINV